MTKNIESAKRIACIGWGSLVWDPQDLPIRRRWYEDGPLVPVEFLRKSMDGRITLVIDGNVKPIRSLWALFDTSDLQVAQAALRDREGTSDKNIGAWSVGGRDPEEMPGLSKWAEANQIDATVWTALPPKFDNGAQRASEQQIVDYLSCLSGSQRDSAEKYVRQAPLQVDTEIRRLIEAQLGWTASGLDGP